MGLSVENQEATEIRAVVKAIADGEAIVEVPQEGCGRCHEKGGCGGQHLSQMLCSTQKTYRVRNFAGVEVGDTVTVSIAGGAVRRSANLAYGLPVLAIIAGAMAGTAIAGDSGAILGGGLGALLAWIYARRVLRSVAGSVDFEPRIVARRGSGIMRESLADSGTHTHS